MKSFKLMDRVVATSGTSISNGFAKGDKGTVVGTSPVTEMSKNGVYVQFDLNSPGRRGDDGLRFADFNQLELIPSDSNPPAGARDNTQQKLDEICARLEKIEKLMVSEPMKEMQESKEPWYPPEEKFGPWVETYGNPIPDVPQDQRVQLLTRWQRINKCGPMHIMLMQTVREDHEKGLRFFSEFVAYRIVL